MNETVVTISVILFPGVLATLIVDNLLNHPRSWDMSRYVVFSFVFGVISYIVLQIATWIVGLFPSKITFLPQLAGTLDIWKLADNQQVAIPITEVFAAVAVSILIAFFYTRIINSRSIQWIKRLTATSKYGNENLFSYYLAAEQLSWVWVRDYEQNYLYEGIVRSFSENNRMQELVLEEVRVFRSSDSLLLESLPSVYICKPTGSFVIEEVPLVGPGQITNGQSEGET